MSERTPTTNPQIIAGTTLESGTPNTGQVMQTFGGSKNYSAYSGTPQDISIHVGGGRLDHVQPHVALSGVQVTFYDSAVATSGGPFSASGHKIVAVVPANTLTAGNVFGAGPGSYAFGMVFTSGLCVATKSGQPGFSVGYTPVVSG